MAFDVFISYSSKDKIAADATCAVLERAGVRCWIAPRDIRPGGEYGAAIIDAIDQCRVMVLIFSASANDSHQIHREIERAVSKSVPIVPVRIEEVVPTKSLEYFLGAIHWLDALSPPLEKHLQQLAETVKALLQVHARGSGAPVDGPVAENSAPAVARAAGGASGGDRPVETSGRSEVRHLAWPSWLVPTLAGTISVAFVVGGLWLYQRTIVPANLLTVPPAPVPTRQAEALVPETVPFIAEGDQATLRSVYLPAPDHKALAISATRIGFVTGQKDDETASTAALEACKRASGPAAAINCQLYAVGNTVVFKGGRPPVAPQPWIVRDPMMERSVVTQDVPLVRDSDRAWLAKDYVSFRKPKAVATALPNLIYYAGQSSTDDAVRRAMEWCSFLRGAPCVILAVDDVIVVPNPKTMKAVDLFQAATNTAIAAEDRDVVARRLANATSGWKAVAVGSNGRPGLGLRAAKEQDAVDAALTECRSRDSNCRIIAIGPFLVEPLPTTLASAPAPAPQPHKVGETFRDTLANGQPCPMCPEMTVVPAGNFTMGSPSDEPEHQNTESPQRPMTIKAPFAVGRFAVTRGEYRAFVEATGHKASDGCFAMLDAKWTRQADKTWETPGFNQDDRHPVVCVSWEDAKAYVAWLSSLTGQQYRLPSEAEREYATRAGTTTPFWWGSTITSEQANYWAEMAYNGVVGGKSRSRTMAVESFKPNPWGLYNVHGNVGELTEDCWSVGHEGAPEDGQPRSGDCQFRVYRNAGFNNHPRMLRSAARDKLGAAKGRNVNVGFRVARPVAP